MSKQAFKRVRRALSLEVNREPLPSYAWPGGYPLLYLCIDGATLCPDCVNREIDRIDADMRDTRAAHTGWELSAFFIHYEGEAELCAHCGAAIESVYGVPE